MLKICKMDINNKDVLDIPIGEKFLGVGQYRGRLHVLFLADYTNQTRKVQFNIYVTDDEITDNPGNYIGTFVENDYQFYVFYKVIGRTKSEEYEEEYKEYQKNYSNGR